MLNQFTHAIKEAGNTLAKLSEHIEDGAEDFADESLALWRRSKKQLAQLKERLAEASQHLETHTDEALLQAHLAAMDAGDHWHQLKHQLSDFSHSVKHKSQPVFDHSALQAHLAKMEARDFIAEAGDKIVAQYQHSREKAAATALKTAQQIKLQCEELLNKKS